VDAAPADTLEVLVVLVHEMHAPDERHLSMEFPELGKILHDQNITKRRRNDAR
jgi:hypothetical protein